MTLGILVGALALLVLAACVVVTYRDGTGGDTDRYPEEDDPDVL